MQITHEEAHRLIQFNADASLDSREKNILFTHLDHCSECRAYAEEIREVEAILLPVMKQRWNLQPVPLSLGFLNRRRDSKIPANTILAIRSLAISLVFVMFIFGFWQFTLLDRRTAGPSPVGLLPVPTPSIESTSTQISFENCETSNYTVQQNDTLESIADQFSISKEELLAINGLKTEIVNTGTSLMIPVCNFTPTGTVHPATLTTTFTPVINPSISPAGPNG
jgi:hypothetical protein